MRGLIIIPDVYYNKISHLIYGSLFDLIKNDLGFDEIGADKIDLRGLKKYDVILSFKSPQKSNVNLLNELCNLNKSKKLITYFSDVHPHLHPYMKNENECYLENMKNMLERSDVILSAYNETFTFFWQDYVDKMIWFPQFVGLPEFSKSVPFNRHVSNKCLVSGALGYYYPFRTYVVKNLMCRGFINILEHPGYDVNMCETNTFKIGRDFYYEVSNHIAALSTTSILNYTLMKHFEIPSVGTILLSDRCKDMDDLGFVPYENYIQVDYNNISDILSTIHEFPNSFEKIRYNGKQFVLNNHTVYHRFNQFKKVLNEL